MYVRTLLWRFVVLRINFYTRARKQGPVPLDLVEDE